jgi:molybdopterin-binding protein
MSKLVAIVKSIRTHQNLNIVEFDFMHTVLKMMSLDLNSNVQVGKKVELLFKPTSVSVSKGFIGEISLSNRIIATIEDLENGELLSSILLKIGDFTLESIITKDSSLAMNLQKNDTVTALIKASDLSISRVLNA